MRDQPDGTKKLTDIKLGLPFVLKAKMVKDKKTVYYDEPIELFNIDCLSPLESVDIIAWTEYDIASNFFRSRVNPGITLTHSEGIGKVKFFYPTGPVGQFFDANYPQLLSFVSIIFSVFLISIIMSNLEKYLNNRRLKTRKE